MNYIKQVEIRWSDLDPNFHLRHSVYYDFGAYCRINFLFDNGITEDIMREHSIGPVLFREECCFMKEIILGDKISISLKLKSVSADFRKFSMQHEIFRNDNELAALLIVDGAWMDTVKRKIAAPPQMVIDTLNTIPKTEDYKTV
ncbi:acyl-CoA thioesterase [Parafilimonas sp.]|uniref:acyl-CoA thioesterase n=1 Tax=Parafilimonas sp. TaxID=1969739 RepID=UPI003F7EAB43